MNKNDFGKIIAHLLILLFYMAQARAPESLLRKKAIEFDVEVLDTPNFHNVCNIIKLKVKRSNFCLVLFR